MFAGQWCTGPARHEHAPDFDVFIDHEGRGALRVVPRDRGALRVDPRCQGVLGFNVGGCGEESKHDPPGSCGVAQHKLGLHDQGDGDVNVFTNPHGGSVCAEYDLADGGQPLHDQGGGDGPC